MSSEPAARSRGGSKRMWTQKSPWRLSHTNLQRHIYSCLRSLRNRIPPVQNTQLQVGISVSGWLFRTCINDTYRLADSLPENSKQEDSCNGWSQVTGNRLDVIEELPTLCWLHNGHPGNADAYQHQDEQPEIKAPQYSVNKWLYMNKYVLLCVRCVCV